MSWDFFGYSGLDIKRHRMNIDRQDFLRILKKYQAGEATEEEKRFLHAYYDLFDAKEDVMQKFSQAEKDNLKDSIKEGLMQQLAVTPQKEKQQGRFVFRWAVAASVLIVSSFTAWLFLKSPSGEGKTASSQTVSSVKRSDIAPGGNKATLTLADGSIISLDEAAKGVLANQNGVAVAKAKEGEVVYQPRPAGDRETEIAYNTITIPRGGQYQLVLPDGSKVWLNSASSIRFPTVFPKGERRVQLKGEAYFEVAKRNRISKGDKSNRLPFVVETPDQEVEVLGTHFNVNAYEDEGETRTTLLEGSVRVRLAGSTESPVSSRLLTPGQQSVLRASARSIQVSEADLEKAVAWKNGYFKFDRENLPSIMRQVSRWYDVDIEYRGEVPQDEFVGKIKRTSYVSDVLRVLKLSNVDCRLEGRKIIVNN